MRAVTTIGVTEETHRKINVLKLRYNIKTKEEVILGLLASCDIDMLKQYFKIQFKKEFVK